MNATHELAASAAPVATSRHHVAHGALGLWLGFSLAFIGFDDWGEVHRMFAFADLRLFLTFVVAVGVSAAVFFALGARHRAAPRTLHKGIVPGAALFGLGWALTGACPSIALVQLGEGKLPALVTLAGILVGTALYGWVHARYFRWDTGSCEV